MFRFLEQSLIMSLVILLMMALVKVLNDKVQPAKRYLCYIIVFVALLIPYRPDIFVVQIPTLETTNTTISEILSATIQYDYVSYSNTECGFDTAVIHTREITQKWNRFRAGPALIFGREMASAIHDHLPVVEGYASASTVFAAADTGTNLWQNITIYQLFLTIWIAGIVAFLAIHSFRHIRFVLAIGRHRIIIEDGPAYEILRRIRRSLKLRKIRLWCNPVATVPVMFGLLRPTIVLPEYKTYIDEDKLNLFILHEALHIKRRDIFTKMLRLAALALHWFNPFVHWLNHHTNNECELACDEAVIEFIGTKNRLSYTQTLLFAAKLSRDLRKAAICNALTSDGEKMKGRLLNIMNNSLQKRWVLVTSTALLLTIVLALSLVSCGRNNESPESGTSGQTVGGPRPGDAADVEFDDTHILHISQTPAADDPNRFYGQTLIISSAFTDTLERLARSYMLLNHGVTVEVIESSREETAMMLMTGGAPILMCHRLVDVFDSRTAGFHADWLPIMDAEPGFDENNYFMNIFDASTVNGRLYNFPITFEFNFVTANNTVPGLADAMERYSILYNGITTSQLMGLHRTFVAQSPLLHDQNFDILVGAGNSINDFFDWDTGQVDFYNHSFIELINSARTFTNPNRELGAWWGINTNTPAIVGALSEMYMFYYIPPLMLEFILDFDGDWIFTGTTPIVNNQGELVVRTVEAYVLNAAATPIEQALALDFMQFAASRLGRYVVASQSHMGFSFVTYQPFFFPVNRDALLFEITGNLVDIITTAAVHNRGITGTRAEIAERAYEQLSVVGEMPMAQIQPDHIHGIINNALRDFHIGLTTADQVAYSLQGRLTAALSEIE